MKTPTLFREYIWLINTIYEARAITLAVATAFLHLQLFPTQHQTGTGLVVELRVDVQALGLGQ